MSLDNVKNEIDILLQEVIDSKNSLEVGTSYRYASDNYRIKAELPTGEDKKVVLNSLETYPDISIRMSVDSISEEYENKLITRDIFRYLKEWSYRYGSKGISVDNMEIPEFGDKMDERDEIIARLNDRVRSTNNLNVNDCSLALRIAGKICVEYGFEDLDDSIFKSDSYKQSIQLLDLTESFIKMKNDGRLNWDLMASTFEDISDQTQKEIIKDVGKSSVIQDLKNFEGDSIDSYLENNVN